LANPAIRIDGILLTLHSRRSIVSRELEESIEERAIEVGTKVYKAISREEVFICEAQTQRMSIHNYELAENSAQDYGCFFY
jgi:hypothetical protein